ncbi:hypothetical protein ABD05_25410 [Burkholderia pyrrocinia]|nr:hypothetical protein ABD05_25410 [Burkholderia pyrrocinia]
MCPRRDSLDELGRIVVATFAAVQVKNAQKALHVVCELQRHAVMQRQHAVGTRRVLRQRSSLFAYDRIATC